MILVTGATGFLGSELVKQLLLQGKTVRALKRQSSKIPEIISHSAGIDWHNADILDYHALKEAMEGVTEVYHCAAMISFRKADKKKMLRVNIEGTAHLVNICLENNIRKLLHTSSISAIGQTKNGGLNQESDHWLYNNQQSNYAISKYESEMEVFRGIAEGLNAVIVNPSIIIGKNAGAEGSGKLINTVKKGLKFYTDGSCSIVDVEDVASTMIRLMESDIMQERFIINSENLSYLDLFTTIARAYGLPAPNIKLSPWMLRTGHIASSFSRLITGREPVITSEIINSAFKNQKYSNDKIVKALKFKFKPVSQTITEIATAV
jgi:dihydroflavonol-4-reductase